MSLSQQVRGQTPMMAVQWPGAGDIARWPTADLSNIGLASLALCTFGQGPLPDITEPQFPHLETERWRSMSRCVKSVLAPAPQFGREEGRAGGWATRDWGQPELGVFESPCCLDL